MKFYDLLAEMSADDQQHLRALMSARGAREEDEVPEEFLELLKEEGYDISS